MTSTLKDIILTPHSAALSGRIRSFPRKTMRFPIDLCDQKQERQNTFINTPLLNVHQFKIGNLFECLNHFGEALKVEKKMLPDFKIYLSTCW